MHDAAPEGNPEEWRPVVGYEGYYSVSNLGRVRRELSMTCGRAGTILKRSPRSRGSYLRVPLSKDNERKDKYVHVLVMAAFVGPNPPGMQVNHKDGDKQNPRLSNLEYITDSQNKIHAFDMGLHKLSGGTRKLTVEEVRQVRGLLGRMYQKDIGKLFGVSQSAVSCIALGKAWTRVPD